MYNCILDSFQWLNELFYSSSVQGEDGFPGFKGDMGLKGDRVSKSNFPMRFILSNRKVYILCLLWTIQSMG